jgi:predicted nucleic acid-binding protein
VLDASIALAWCFKDESSVATFILLEHLEQSEAIVPSLWHLEISNVLITAERKGRITYADVNEIISYLSNLPIQTDYETSNYAFHEILLLAYSEKLSAYDAAYLELALRRGFPLATKDQLLKNVATKLGVHVLNT